MGKAKKTPELSLVIPVYNQGSFISSTLSSLYGEFSDIDVEIIVVDDGSKHDADLLEGVKEVFPLGGNQGKGAAVKKGMEMAEGEVILYTDADLSYSSKFLRELFLAVKAGVPAAFGVREPGRAGIKRNCGSRYVGRRIRRLLGEDFDTQCGAKAFSKSTAKEIFPKVTVKRFAFDVEVYCLLQEANIDIKQLPAEAEVRKNSTVKIKDGLCFLRDLRKIKKNRKRGLYG